jgi:hypothetical protein
MASAAKNVIGVEILMISAPVPTYLVSHLSFPAFL